MKNLFSVSSFFIFFAIFFLENASYAASSVRSLGGSGTYTSASSASIANASSTSAASRSGSVRVTPSTGSTSNSVKVSSSNSSTGRVATTPRLSIGQYLGGGTSVSGGSSIRPQNPGNSGSGSSSGDSGGTMDPGIAADLQKDIEQLQQDVLDLNDAKDDLVWQVENKQDILVPADDFISIEDSEIFVNVDNLTEALAGVVGKDGKEIELDKIGDYLVWRYVGDTSWNDLIAIADIMGPQGPQGEKGEKGEKGDPGDVADIDLSLYATIDRMNSEISSAVEEVANTYATKNELLNYVTIENADNKYATKEELTTGLSGKLDNGALSGYATSVGVQAAIMEATDGLVSKEELNSSLATKANVADVYNKTEVYNKEEVENRITEVATGGVSEALKDYAKIVDVEAGLAEKADKTALEAKAEATELNDLSSKVDAIDVQLANKVNSSDLGALATKSLIVNADVADNAGIERSKLAEDVRLSLEKADNSINVISAGANKVLGTDANGDKIWYEVVLY